MIYEAMARLAGARVTVLLVAKDREDAASRAALIAFGRPLEEVTVELSEAPEGVSLRKHENDR